MDIAVSPQSSWNKVPSKNNINGDQICYVHDNSKK